MRKKLLTMLLSCAFVCGVVLAVLQDNTSRRLQGLELANIEALATEEDLVEACSYSCWANEYYDCLLYTNKGFTITCVRSYPNKQ